MYVFFTLFNANRSLGNVIHWAFKCHCIVMYVWVHPSNERVRGLVTSTGLWKAA